MTDSRLKTDKGNNMRELHTDDASATNDLINPTAAQTDLGTVENGPELATGGNEDSDTTNQDADNGVNKAINKAHHLKHKAERATLAETQRADELQARLDAIDANKPAPIVSEMPDRFEATDEEWAAAEIKQAGERQVRADYDATQKARQTASQAEINKQNVKRQEEAHKIGLEYVKRADGLGISRDNLQKASEMIANYGVSDDVIEHIAVHENGPLIVQYLTTNSSELSDLASMNPMQAAVYISNVLSDKSAALRPKTSNAPDPVVPLSGNGVDPNASKHPAFKGGTYS